MLTLLGPGGIGKSTLARMVADAVTDRFPDGARIVELESVADPGDVPLRVAADLGFGLDRRLEPIDQVLTRLHHAELLLGARQRRAPSRGLADVGEDGE